MLEDRDTNSEEVVAQPSRLEQVLAEYLQASVSGANPSREELLAKYPDLADDLREFFANRDQMDRLAKPLASAVPPYDKSTLIRSEAEQIGLSIGPYTLVQKLGEGGMGEVWVAKQSEPVKRKVALKLIKRGMNSKDVLARFEQERQALAMMDHPNIAKVFDGGVVGQASSLSSDSRQAGSLPHDGQPYFVMELVNGLPLTKFCDEARLTPRQRMELFVPICQAVQHAHQKGIVHRDLKPSNILVTIYDGKPVPKVIDFGVAKATGGKLTDESLSTQFGAVVGTLEYMSPEQAGFSGQDIDTRADIYSLGVILYELLTGLRPIDAQRLRKAAFTEMIRIIQEEEPSKPSTRLSSNASLPSLAALRQTDPKRLTALLRGELDWVVMKCLEKSRDRRYETVNGLARDIQRYLTDEPVEARPPSFGYRANKFLRRNRRSLVTASLLIVIVLTMVSLVVVHSYNSRLANVNTRLTDALGEANQERQNADSARQLADTRRSETEKQRVIAEQQRQEAVKQKSLAKEAEAKAQRYLYASQMILAERAKQEGNIGRVMQLLRSAIPESPDQEDLRGFEWHHLWRQYNGEQSRLRGHKGAVTAVVFSPDDRLLASASADKTVKLWDAIKRVEMKTLEGHDDRVNSLSFSPDGSYLISGGSDAKVILWEAKTGLRVRKFEGHRGPITAVAFSPDGSRIASGSADKTVRVWDTKTAQTTHEFKSHTCQVSGVAFSLDGSLVASTGQDGVVTAPRGEAFVWNSNTGEIKWKFGGDLRANEMPLTCVTYSPDGKSLVAGGISGRATSMTITIQVWEAETGKSIKSVKAHDSAIQQLAFSPDGKQLVSSSVDQTIKVWDFDSSFASGKATFLFQEEAACLSSVFSHDGLRIASGSEDTTIKLWSLPLPEARTHFEGKRRISSVAFSPDGSRIAAESAETVYVWDATDRSKSVTWKNPNSHGRLAWTPDGKSIAIGGAIWTAESGKRIDAMMDNLAVGPLAGMGTALSKDGKLLAAVASLTSVAIWDTNSGRRVALLQPTSAIPSQTSPSCWPCCVAFSPDGRMLAIGSGTDRFPLPGSLEIWDVANSRFQQRLEGFRDAVIAVAFSPNGKQLAAGIGDPRGFSRSNPGEVRIWETETWQELHNFRGHQNCVYAVAFSPDGKRLASAAGRFTPAQRQHGEVKLWDLTIRQEVATRNVSPRALFGVSFSPCGQYLATAGDDGTVRILDGTPLAETPSRDGLAEAK